MANVSRLKSIQNSLERSTDACIVMVGYFNRLNFLLIAQAVDGTITNDETELDFKDSCFSLCVVYVISVQKETIG